MRGSLGVLAFAAIPGLLYYGRWVLIPFVFALFILSPFTSDLDWLVMKVRLPALAGNALEIAWSLISGLVLTLIFVFLLLASRNSRLRHKGVYAAVDKHIRRYLARKIALSPLVGVVVWSILIVVLLEVFELIMGYFVEPKALGGAVDLHLVAVLLAIGFWSLVWGIVGAFPAVPLTAVIRVTMLQTTTVRAFGPLLGGRVPERVEGATEPG